MTTAEQTAGKNTLPAPVETWGGNEVMRHVPTLAWIIQKLGQDVRRTVGILYDSYRPLGANDPRQHELDNAFRSLGRSLERLSEAARHGRPAAQTSADLGTKLTTAINHAISCLESIDGNLFGRRYPVQTHERSKGETVYAALLVVLSQITRVKTLTRAVDPGLDERLLDGLVVRALPLNDEVLRPIA